MDGLEFDRRNDSPIPLPKPDRTEKYAYNQQPSGGQMPQTPVASDPGPLNKRCCRLRSTTFILSAALAVIAVLAIIAAGVGGSLAAKRVHCNPDTLVQPTSSSVPQVPNDNPNTVAQPTSSFVPQVPNESLCPTVNSTTNSTTNATASIIPTSNCDKLANKYVSTVGTHTEFNVYCESDLLGHDFLGVFVYFFEDCIETCATFNLFQTNNGTETAEMTCYGVAFALDFPKNPRALGGNCFLKDVGGITVTHRDHTSAASLAQS